MTAILIVSLVAVGIVVFLALFPIRITWFYSGSEPRTKRHRGKSKFRMPFSSKGFSDVDEVYDDEEL